MAEVFLVTTAQSGSQPGSDASQGDRCLSVVKRIWPELASDPEFMAMFLDEAQLALGLRHPNIVETFALDYQDGAPYIAMEYLAGQPLSQVLSRLRGSGQLAPALRLQILRQVLLALDHAHRLVGADGTPLGIVHRDVSPYNVFVTYDGRVKLMDFGIARSLAASHHTRAGVWKGRLAYVAPEQLRSRAFDCRADVFSAGVMLWEMLADQRLWKGKSEAAIVQAVTGRARLPRLPDDLPVPDRLREVCARALSLSPQHRHQSAAELASDLEELLGGEGDPDATHLGEMVAKAFSTERQELERAIDEFFQLGDVQAGQPGEVQTRHPVPDVTSPRVAGGPVRPTPSSLSIPAVQVARSMLARATRVRPAGGGHRSWRRFRSPALGALAVVTLVLGVRALLHRQPPPPSLIAGRAQVSAALQRPRKPAGPDIVPTLPPQPQLSTPSQPQLSTPSQPQLSTPSQPQLSTLTASPASPPDPPATPPAAVPATSPPSMPPAARGRVRRRRAGSASVGAVAAGPADARPIDTDDPYKR